jgi:hypothetical protein
MIMARSPGCGLIGWVATDVLPQRGLAFHSLPPQPLVRQQSPGERAASYALLPASTIFGALVAGLMEWQLDDGPDKPEHEDWAEALDV